MITALTRAHLLVLKARAGVNVPKDSLVGEVTPDEPEASVVEDSDAEPLPEEEQ